MMTTVNGQRSTDFVYFKYLFIIKVSVIFFTKSSFFIRRIEFYFVTL